MVATRKGPYITVKVRKEFDDDGIGGLRNEIALSDFQFLAPKRGGFWQELVSSAGSENQEVGCAPFALYRVTWFLAGRIDGYDVRAMDLATSVLRALEEQAIQYSA